MSTTTASVSTLFFSVNSRHQVICPVRIPDSPQFSSQQTKGPLPVIRGCLVNHRGLNQFTFVQLKPKEKFSNTVTPVLYSQNPLIHNLLTQENSLLDDEISEREPLTWYKVSQSAEEDQALNRYITKVIPSTPSIEKSRPLEVEIGVDKNCENRRGDKDFCNGPLGPGKKYR